MTDTTPRRALVLGGTSFIGRHTVEALLRRGLDVTLFNRGISDRAAFDLPLLIGDRSKDVAALEGTDWDLVVDVSAYHPDEVELVADAIGRVGHYVFVSTISVYADFSEIGMSEDAPLLTLDGPVPDEPTMELYGELKVLAEERVAVRFPHHAIIRPCIVAGPHDPTDRFTYWVQRIAEPGPHIVPPDLEQYTQVIDVRDLAEFIATVGADNTEGIVNGAGEPVVFRELLDTIASAAGTTLETVPLTSEQMETEGVAAWTDLPLWRIVDDSGVGFFRVSHAAATAAGLTLRPLAETVAATLEWSRGRELARGVSREREAELVARYGPA